MVSNASFSLNASVTSTAVAVGLTPLLSANQAQAAIIATDDARLDTQHLSVKGKLGETKSYLAYPKKASKLPAVIVIHENRGLNAHIEDIARRLALEGFLVLAPDLLSPLGGTPTDEDAARTMIGKLESTQTLQQCDCLFTTTCTQQRQSGCSRLLLGGWRSR